MKDIRSTTTMLALIGDGDLVAELDEAMKDLNAALIDHTGGRKKAKAKGEITLKLAFTVTEGTCTISPEIKVSKPKKPRSDGFFWLTKDGNLSTEHPQQMRMDFPDRARGGEALVPGTSTAIV